MLKTFVKITPREWRLVAGVTLALLLITSLPYLYAWLVTPNNQVYLGTQAVNPGDWPVYYSYIEQVKDGKLLLTNLYTADHQEFSSFNIFWLSLGLGARASNLSAITVFHLARLLLIPIFIGLAYIFLSYFFKRRKDRTLAFFLLMFSAGLGGWVSGWLNTTQGLQLPMDLWVPESNIFLTLYHSPHIIASTTLMLLSFLLLLHSFQTQQYKYAVLAGLAGLVLFQFHPFHVITIYAVAGVFLVVTSLRARAIPWKKIGLLALFIILSLPAILYHFALLQLDWLNSQRAMQNITPTPPWWLVLISYGFLIPLALVGIRSLFKSRPINERVLFLVTWFVVQLVLFFSPLITFQRRLTQGFHIIAVLLASYGLIYLLKKLSTNWTSLKLIPKNLKLGMGVMIFILLLGVSPIFNIFRDVMLAQEGSKVFYEPRANVEAMKWLREHTAADSLVLATLSVANELPGLAVRRVYAGHTIESPFYKTERRVRVYWIFNARTDNLKREQFIRRENINYIFYRESDIYPGFFKPEEQDYLQLVYRHDGVLIYKVI